MSEKKTREIVEDNENWRKLKAELELGNPAYRERVEALKSAILEWDCSWCTVVFDSTFQTACPACGRSIFDRVDDAKPR